MLVATNPLEPVIDRIGRAGLDRVLFEVAAACASRLVERVDAGVPFVGWARGPFPVSGVRRDSGHTCTGHMTFLSACPGGDVVGKLQRRATWRGGQDGHSEMLKR
jgi:hypothetical protein